MNVSALSRSKIIAAPTGVYENSEFNTHEQVVFASAPEVGLKAIIAIHNTGLGPAMGGCRMWPYTSSDEALTDALRLSEGMTYKNAMAGIPYGGGKAVIIADPKTEKTSEMMRAFGAHVERLAGRYITAEDVGISTADMDAAAQETSYARGTSTKGLGDPSPFTALGVFEGIKAAAEFKYGSPSLEGRTLTIQGLGHVGWTLCEHLHSAGAKLLVADLSDAQLHKARQQLGAEVIAPDTAHQADCDIYVPCALGACLNSASIPQIKARIVAGAANNQLATTEDGVRLHERDILLAPDYIINAGGVISVALGEEHDAKAIVTDKTLAIGKTLKSVFATAQQKNVPTSQVAEEMARARLTA
ncbi:Glu/Leu/Phe/Val dehydrogenase dimerization domain-containing protein [Polycladidibacter hongkongensis]|uniref:Glu/Leu/Phe/Val dehydrogenase dimerization domain-containing protein n=1 Tax=Polycladidibacter hongkongensis TaxID=1647556 RepID=UPI00082E73D2|nr:Glu/Leu/Phe/Val dehydrogenase dimerization domain-containing protein [Pseudovibrio hongkongensis]